ncbi:MAG: aspartate aminotransferase family protein [Flavobacteriales bacterium]|nr:aspartate aminotransferase family protein [Flavobacteriales bacterium]
MTHSPLAATSPKPIGLDIREANGVYLTDASGRSYIDLISGIAVSNLGHRHPAITEAIRSQAGDYLHAMVYGEYVLKNQTAFAQQLASHLPPTLQCIYPTNSGSEAVEGALKLAKKYTGRTSILAFQNAYHGSTHGALSVTGNDQLKQGYGPLLPEVHHLVFNEPLSIQLINRQTAAVIIEVIQGEAGVVTAEPDFLQALRNRCTETGTLLIFDESQTAMGRTGTLFAFEPYNIIPDILVLSKALGGGMPLGAFIASHEIMNVLSHNPALGHISTFGGHPLSCAAGLAHLNALMTENLMQAVEQKEQLFRAYLQHSKIREIRGKGLMLAVELGDASFRERVCDAAIAGGVITDWFLFCDTAIRIAPPLVITENEIRKACDVLLQAIETS